MNAPDLSAFVSLLVVASGPAFAQSTWFVDDDACPGPGTGTVGDPFCRIQDAIGAATHGDRVLVAEGIYFESINFEGKAVAVLGEGADTTKIDATGLNSSTVVFDSGEGSESGLHGFKVTGGNAQAGGGILCEESSPTLTELHVVCNTALDGAGMMIRQNSHPNVVDCIIDSNFATTDGGAVKCVDTSSPSFVSCRITNNMANTWAGGLYVTDGGNLRLEHCLIANNSAGDKGGALTLQAGSNLVIENCTIAFNAAGHSLGGGAIFMYHGGGQANLPTLLNCILWGNTPQAIHIWDGQSGTVTATYSDISGGLPGTGNLNANPQFVDAPGGNYHLGPDSPCIDAGDPRSSLDCDGSVADMGALSFAACECTTNNYCVTTQNSVGFFARIEHEGLPSLSMNSFSLTANGLPPNQFGVFFFGPLQTIVPFGGGFRCVDGVLTRLDPPVQFDDFGLVQRPLDFTRSPLDDFIAGDATNFQLWYRDPQLIGAQFNLTNALEVTICP